MFQGINSVSLDHRGRVALPMRFRERVSYPLVVTLHIDRCLSVYAKPDYERLAAELEQLDTARQDVRDLVRRVIGCATETELDSNGRMLIPQQLRDYTQMEKKVVVLGQFEKLELWAEKVWERVSDRRDEAGDRAGDLAGLEGIEL